MDRRALLLAAIAGAFSVPPRSAQALLQCSPFYPNGWQRCSAGIDGRVLSIRAQENSQWCWAACISAVFDYYGYSVSQSAIVRETWGDVYNMPGSPYQIVQDLNASWTDASGRDFYVSGDVMTANAITAAQDLAQDMPLIIGSQGHAMVLYAVTYDRNAYGQGNIIDAQVMDPWPTAPRIRSMRPDEWYATNFLVRIRVD
jgi:hypothetical protein